MPIFLSNLLYANYINSMKNKGKLVLTQTILDQYFEYYIINVGTGFVLEVICKTSIHDCDMINGYFLPNNNVIDEVKKDLKKYLNYVLTK